MRNIDISMYMNVYLHVCVVILLDSTELISIVQIELNRLKDQFLMHHKSS